MFKLQPSRSMDDITKDIQMRIKAHSVQPQQYADNVGAQQSYPGQTPPRQAALKGYLEKKGVTTLGS